MDNLELTAIEFRARFRHVEAPGQPSVVELWRPTLH